MLIVLAVAAAGLFVFLHPVARPAANAGGWSAPGGPGDTALAPAARAGAASARSSPAALVYVAGEVNKPGVYRLAPQGRVADMIALAGGARPTADLVAVNLAARVEDGEEIVVPAKGAPPARGRRRRAPGSGASDDTPPSTHRKHGAHRAHHHQRTHVADASPAGTIDINTADAPMLATIPGIGAGLAERIVEFRTANGPFTSVDELLDVSGITDRRLEAILPYVVAR